MRTALMKNRGVIALVALCAGFLLAYLVLPRPAPKDDVYVIVEDMPELVGGMAAIQGKVTYPESAVEEGVEGRVFVQFVVNEDGTTGNVVVQKGIGAGLDEEAVRVVSEAKFTPGMQDGEAVKVRMVIPITFKLKPDALSEEALRTPKDGIYVIVENMPEPVGGIAAIQTKVTYPESAREAGVEGRVFVHFVVNEQGDVQDVVVTQGVSSDLDEEAVRVMKEAKFTPGMQDGKPVKVRMAIPITFKLPQT